MGACMQRGLIEEGGTSPSSLRSNCKPIVLNNFLAVSLNNNKYIIKTSFANKQYEEEKKEKKKKKKKKSRAPSSPQS